MADEAARALREARSRLASGNLEGARTSALDVIERFPAAPGSGEALEILARAFLGLGDTAGAVDAAQRYLELLDRAHPAGPGAQLLLSQALAQNADTELSFGNLLQLPENMGADTRDGALELTRAIIGDIGIEGLREAAEGLGPRHPLRGVVLTELAVALFLQGEVSESERWAGAALEGDLGPREGELCRAVLGGNLEEVLGQSIVLGAILPLSGVSPGLMGYGQEVLEGIQVAVEEVQGELRRPIRLELFDHGGEAREARKPS